MNLKVLIALQNNLTIFFLFSYPSIHQKLMNF